MAHGPRPRWVACGAVDHPSASTSAAAPEPAPAQPEGSTDTGEHSVAPTASTGAAGFLARGRVRRRARFLRKARELAYRDLGGLVFNLHRFGKRNDPLVLAKLSTIERIDSELRGLESALGESRPVTVLREAGVTACPRCAAIHSSEDRFCPSCGLPLSGRADLPIAPAAAPDAPAVVAASAPTAQDTPPGAMVPPAAESPAASAPAVEEPAPVPAPAAASEHTPAPTGVPPASSGATPAPPAEPPAPAGADQGPTDSDEQVRSPAPAGRSPRPPRRARPGSDPGAQPGPAASAPNEPPATAMHSSVRAPAAGKRPNGAEEEPTEIVPPAAPGK